ncbi:MAG TPA: hypothetical protein VFP91_20525, partial [Vicinamibacterales bacterium]|nr:hypothetical protein [Vicinamibacterales bacterium]
MSTKTEKQSLHEKIASRISGTHARIEALKAKAHVLKAVTELKLLADLEAQKKTLDKNLSELKTTAEPTYEKAKADVETRVARLEKQVQAI